MSEQWIYVRVQIVGNLETWSLAYYWDGRKFPTRKAAISAGIRDLGHDDFCIGGIRGEHLTWWGWQDQPHPEEDREAAAAGIGLIP